MSRFEHRGVVEGYYGPAFEDEDRLDLIEAMGRWGMNLYLYAPKNDPLQRERWREPYPEEMQTRFREWIRRGDAAGVKVGFAISPGLSIRYADAADTKLLVEKFANFRDLGARFFALTLDDVASELRDPVDRSAFDTLAAAQISLAHTVAAALGDESLFWFVPTDYSGTGASAYLEELGAGLDPRIEVGWTGRTVVSPSILVREAAKRAATLRRRLLIWDNFPVSDGPMRVMLHLGPYEGREVGLAEHVSGFLLNPMQRARASKLALRTAADYLADPERYDAQSSWQEALREVADTMANTFGLFASAHRFSALAPDDRDRELEAAFVKLRHALQEGASMTSVRTTLRSLVELRANAADSIRENLDDARLVIEIEPWLTSHERECARIQIALDCLTDFAAAANGMERIIAFSRFEGRLTRNPPGEAASFGPRRILYPQLVSMSDDTPGYGSDDALILDRCLADEIVYEVERWVAARLDVHIVDGRKPGR